MKPAPNIEAEKFRVAGPQNENYGAFQIKVGPFRLRAIISVGMGWDHVSVSLQNRCPTWPEMDAVKKLFFKDTETVMQLHVPSSDHINIHPFCLHLWRPQTMDELQDNKESWLKSGEPLNSSDWACHPSIPLPPKVCV